MAELEKIKLGQTEYDIHDPKALPKSGTMTGALVLSGDPTVPNGAATKQYVDAQKVQTASFLPTSGTALTGNWVYAVSAAVNTYSFTPPVNNGWSHGVFTTGTTPNITFTGKIIFAANKTYEFDVYRGVWIVQEVATQWQCLCSGRYGAE